MIQHSTLGEQKMDWRCRFGLHHWRYIGKFYFDEDKKTMIVFFNKRECKRCGFTQLGDYGVSGPFKTPHSSASTARNEE